jgi:hypothetical protein
MYIIIIFYFFSGGLTNLLYTCELSDNIQTRPGEARTVLLRVYGDIAKDLKFLVQNSGPPGALIWLINLFLFLFYYFSKDDNFT